MNLKPKLLIAADTYYPKVDGVLVFITEFLKRSTESFEVSLIVPKYSSKNKFKDVKIILLDLTKRVSAFTYSPIGMSRINRKKIKQAVKENDIIFIQELGPVGFLTQYYARRFKKKIIHYVHNTPWEFLEKHYSLGDYFGRLIKSFLIRLYNKSDLLLVPYTDFKNELKKIGVKTKMEVTRLGVDIDRFKPTTNKLKQKTKLRLSQKKIIGYVGRVSKEKNTLILLDAFKHLKDKDAHLLIVGDGEKDLIKKFKETKHCKVTGFVENVEEYFKAMDVFVMPSLTETTSLATLEAMATGIPVISTKVGFMQHYIIKDYNGVFFPRNSAQHLAMKIDRILEDHEFAKKISTNARKTVAYSFSWERSINRIKRVLYQIYHKKV